MKKLISISLFLVAIAVSLVSCLKMDGGENSTSYSTVAVVSYNLNKGGSTLLTSGGEFGAPEIASAADLKPGDCIYAQITLDFDNQPFKEYITATKITYLPVDQSIVDIRDEEPAVDSILPIKAITGHEYHPILKGKLFLQMAHDVSTKQEITYIMTALNNDVASDKKTTDVYLIAKKEGTASGSSTPIKKLHAFDILNAINILGKDTIVKASAVEYPVKELNVNLKYCSDVKDGMPVYTDYTPSTPLNIAIYR
jgi:hypothetical protein